MKIKNKLHVYSFDHNNKRVWQWLSAIKLNTVKFSKTEYMYKARHLSGSAFCWVDIGLPEQAVGWFPPRFGIGCGRWTY